MASQIIVNGVKEGIIDLSIAALHQDETTDQVAHAIFSLFQNHEVMPAITNNVRRLFPTYDLDQQPSDFSPEAIVAMSGIMFGLVVLEALPVDRDATKYMLSRELALIRDSNTFYEIGSTTLGEIDFVPESIPYISVMESKKYELELWSGFGLVVSNSLEAYRYQHDYTAK
jgi:hypothetical protein